MIKEIFMPKLGQTVEEAVVERWHKKEGDPVKKGEVLLEITTDKATLEVESFVEGTLRKIVVPEGATVPVNSLIAFVGNPDDPVPEVSAGHGVGAAAAATEGRQPARAAAGKSEPPAAAVAAASFTAAGAIRTASPVAAGRQFVSPRARRRARELRVPVRCLRGSGPNGRVIEQDVLEYARRRGDLKITPLALQIAYDRGIDLLSLQGTGPGGKISREDVEAAQPAPQPGALRRVPLTPMRRIIAQRMAESKATVPHFYLDIEVDMTALIVLRSELNSAGTVKISFNDLILRACALAFQQVPLMNVSWGGDALLYREAVDIGIAVALEDGLIVPVVRNLQQKTLETIARETQGLIEKARSKRLTPDDYGNASMTLSNLGMYDVQRVFPIINPGESCILGVGRIAEKVVARHGGIHVRNMACLVLACDHRVVDGAIAAQFFKAAKDALENPSVLKT